MIYYELTLEDYVAFHMYAMKELKHYRSTLFLYRYGFSLIFLAAILLLTREQTYDGALSVLIGTAVLLFSLLCYFLGPKLLELMIRKNIASAYKRGNITSRGPFSVTYDAKGLVYNNGNNSGKYKWSTIERFEETAHHLFLYISGVEAVTIPKRAFANESALRDFADNIKLYLKR